MTKLAMLLLLSLTLAACATNYRHQTKSGSDFDRDMYECERDAAPVQDRARNRQMIERCMRVKGWQSERHRWAAVLPF